MTRYMPIAAGTLLCIIGATAANPYASIELWAPGVLLVLYARHLYRQATRPYDQEKEL